MGASSSTVLSPPSSPSGSGAVTISLNPSVSSFYGSIMAGDSIGGAGDERASFVSVRFSLIEQEVRLRTLTVYDRNDCLAIGKGDPSSMASSETKEEKSDHSDTTPGVTVIEESFLGTGRRNAMPLTLTIPTIVEEPSDEDDRGPKHLEGRLSGVRGLPAAQTILSEVQNRHTHVGRSLLYAISFEIEDGPDGPEIIGFYSSDEDDFEDLGLSGYESPGEDWIPDSPGIDDKKDDRDRMVHVKPPMAPPKMSDRSKMKSIAFLEDYASMAPRSGRLSTVSEIEEIKSKSVMAARNRVMKERLAKIHITLVGAIFGDDLKGALPDISSLSPRSLKHSMASMVDPFSSAIGTSHAHWTGVYCSGQLMSDIQAPWMRAMNSHLRAPLKMKKKNLFISDKLYTHEYDSVDPELILIDESLVFPILPFDIDHQSGKKVEFDEDSDKMDLSVVHPQIAYECFQDLCVHSDLRGHAAYSAGFITLKLKQMVYGESAAPTTDSPSAAAMKASSDPSTGATAAKRGVSHRGAFTTAAKGLGFSSLRVIDLLDNISDITAVKSSDSSTSSSSESITEYQSDEFLFQLPLFPSIDAAKLTNLRSEMDRLGVATVSDLVEKSRSEEGEFGAFVEREVIKPKACGVLVCQCRFQW